MKASAALQGQSIKDYVLERTLPDADEQTVLQELEGFFKPRIKAANSGDFSSRSLNDIFDEVEKEQLTRK